MGYTSRQCFRFWNKEDDSWHGPYFDSQDELDEFHDWVLAECAAKWVTVPKVSTDPAMVKMLNRLGPHYYSIDEKYLEELKEQFIEIPVDKTPSDKVSSDKTPSDKVSTKKTKKKPVTTEVSDDSEEEEPAPKTKARK